MARLILKKSSVVEDGVPKQPAVGDLEYGELAINYAVGTLYYKKSDNTIASIGAGAAPSNGTLTLQAQAGLTNTSVSIGTGTGFSANTATDTTYQVNVGPALTALAGVMTGAGSGFIKKTGADTYEVDTNTYVSSAALANYLPLAGGTLTGTAVFSSAYAGGSGDWTNITTPTYTIDPTSGFWRIVHKSQHASISGVYNYQTAKDVFWGEPTDTGNYYFRGRALKWINNVGTYDILHSNNYNSYALPLTGGTITGAIVAANNTVGGVFGNLEVGYNGYYNTLQTKTSSDTLWLQYAHAGSIGIGYGGGSTTFYGRATFQNSIDTRPQFPGGILGLDTGDGNFDIWGISRDYYPSHATVANAWGIRWDGDSNQVRFIGGGTVRLAVDLDGGASGLTWEGNAVLNSSNYSSYALPLTGGTLTGDLQVNTIRDTGGVWILGKNGNEISIGSTQALNGIVFNSSADADFKYRTNPILHAGNYTTYTDPKYLQIGRTTTSGAGITTESLILYLDFNNKNCSIPLKNLSGTDYTITNSNISITTKEGIGATYNNGTGGYLIVDGIVLGTTMTYEAWAWADGFSNYDTIFDNGSERPLLGTNGGTMVSYPDYGSGPVLATGRWYHLVWVFSAGSTYHYINGQLEGQGSYAAAQFTNLNKLWIGGDGGGETWNGYIAIARVYNKALNVSEITRNFEAERTRFFRPWLATTNVASEYTAQNGFTLASASTEWSGAGFHIGDVGYVYSSTSGSTGSSGGAEYIDYLVPHGAKTCYINHLAWDSGGYFDVYGKRSTGEYKFLARINCFQNASNQSTGNTHDGVRVDKVSSLELYTHLRFHQRKGRIHLMGLGWTAEEDQNFSTNDYTHWDNLFGLPGTILHSANYSSYALPLTGGTVTGLTYFTADESIQVKGVRGQLTGGSDNQGIHLFSNVDIGYPSGWGGGLPNTPSRGLSTWGAVVVAYGNNADSTFYSRTQFRRNGRTTAYTGSNLEVYTEDNTAPGISFHRGGYSATLLYENDGELYVNPWTTRSQTGKLLAAGNYTSFNAHLRALGGNDAMDFNTLEYNSMYYAYIQNSANKPPSYGYAYGTILTFDPGVGTAGRAQMYISHAGNDLCFRGGWNGNDSWQTWNRTLTDQNYNSYSPTLTGGGASGTWGISITGNAATASNASNSWQLGSDTGSKSNALQYWQLVGDNTLNPSTEWHYAIRMSHGDAATYYSATLALSFFSDTFQFRRKTGGTNQSWRTIIHDGNYTNYALPLSGGTINGNVTINGTLSATTKSFLIDHPTKPGKKLRYGSLEGPENGVYVRGRLQGTGSIQLPDYWTGLVHADSITVNLTAASAGQQLYVERVENNCVYIVNETGKPVSCFYTVYGERKDVDKLEVEID
jgi:hypothetical protein